VLVTVRMNRPFHQNIVPVRLVLIRFRCRYEKYSTGILLPYGGAGLRLTICTCYSVEVALSLSFGASPDNALDRKGMR
jgi:hypothetical protein